MNGDPILSEIAASVCRRFGMPTAVFRMDGSSTTPTASHAADEETLRLLGEALPRRLKGVPTRGTGVLPGEDAGTDAAFLAAAREPLSDGAWAVLCVFDPRARDFPASRLALLSLFAEAAAQRMGRECPERDRAFERSLGVYSESFLRRLCLAEIEDGAAPCLLAYSVEGLSRIREQQGEETARRLSALLADLLRTKLRASDSIGVLAPDALAVLLPDTPLTAAPLVAAKLREPLRKNFRFPLAVGAAAAEAPEGAPRDAAAQGEDLFRRLRLALEEAAGSGGGDRIRIHTRSGVRLPADAYAAPAPSPGPMGPALQTRFQKLVLLNRISIELFGQKTLPASLQACAHSLLALSGASCLAVFQRKDVGGLALSHAQGHGAQSADSPGELWSLAEESLRSEKTLWGSGAAADWLVIPVPGPLRPLRIDGVLATRHPPTKRPSDEDLRLLQEAARLLGSAFLAHRQLREQKMLAAVTEQSADPILLTDLHGRVTAWSRGAEEVFQYRSSEVLGRNIVEFFVPEDQMARYLQTHGEALEKGSLHGFETVRLRKDGTLVPVEMTLTVVRDDQGKPFGMVRILRDITRRKEIERMKSEFVTLVSHELRTPLTSIRGFAEAILSYWTQLSEEQKKKYLNTILDECRRLGKLVNDFLDVSRLESGRSALDLTEVDLRALAEKVVETMKGHAGDLRFEVEVPEGLPRPRADLDQVQRVIINLCGNAVKYSPKGGTVRIVSREDSGFVETEVRDQGPGMSPEQRKRLFEKFYRADDEVASKTPGTGLGLAICKGIVEAHGGSIGVRTTPGAGAAFFFRLPIAGPSRDKID